VLSQHVLFFFAALGAFNGAALAMYLWWAADRTSTQRWLALLIFFVSVRTGKSVIFYFWPDTPKTVLQIGLTACFLIGPSLFFLIRFSLKEPSQRSGMDIFHIVALISTAMGVGLLFPYAIHVNFWRLYVGPSITYVWLMYLLVSTLMLYLSRARLISSGAWALLVGTTTGCWIIWGAYYLAGYTSYIVGALSFSFVLYLSVAVYFRYRSGKAPIEPYHDRRIPEAEASSQLQALTELMERERLHLDSSLTLPRLARRFGVPQTKLSQLLNDNNQTSFKQYLTQLRVEEAKRLLCREPAQALDEIAQASGFQSMSTFYNAFKKVEGITPAAFRQRSMTPGTDFRSPKSDSNILI
jgi:AraC-like DNA-binding protein